MASNNKSQHDSNAECDFYPEKSGTDEQSFQCVCFSWCRFRKCMNAVKKEWNVRRSLWLSFHYRNYIGRKESLENVQLLMVKRDVLRCLGENSTCCMIIISDLQKVSVPLVERKLRGIEFVMRCRWFLIWSKPCTVWLYDMFNMCCVCRQRILQNRSENWERR